MKQRLLLVSLITLFLLITVSTGFAYVSGYSLPWWTVDGGGGTSISAQYSLNGTIGQPDGGMLSGGEYKLSGGFWADEQLTMGQLFLPIVTR
jgi:hypothetical protein